MVSLLSLLAVTALPQAAHAGVREEARKHYDRAIDLVDDGQLAEAIVEFQRSYDLTKHFSVLYNIGQVYVSLAKPVEAIAAYEAYLVGGGKSIPAARRAEVEKELARQKARIATLVFHVLPDGATISLDGTDIGKAPLGQTLSVGIGEHVVSATAEGHEPAEVRVIVAGEDRRTVELALVALPEKMAEPEPEPAPVVPSLPPAVPTAAPAPTPVPVVAPTPAPAPVATVADSPPTGPPMTGVRVAGIAAGIVGIAGIVTGSVCWLVADKRHDDAVATWNKGTNDAEAQSLQGEAQDYATAANVGMLVGGALAGLGVVLYFVGAPDSQTSSPDRHAYVRPTLSPGLVGIRAGGTW